MSQAMIEAKANPRWKAYAKRSKWLIVANGAYVHQREKIAFSLGRVDSQRGATHRNLTLSQSLGYIHKVYNEYLQFTGLSPAMLSGKRVLEVGPGDNMGVALKFLAAGAAQVVCLDKFFSKRDEKQQREVYQALRAQLSEAEKTNYDSAIDLSGPMRFNSAKLRYIYGTGIEVADTVLGRESFDLIISRAVMQEIPDIDRAFEAMDRLLRPGGIMGHQIDLRDYGFLSDHGFHPLEFLTIPNAIYKLTGQPNRRLRDYYRRKAEALGHVATVHTTDVLTTRNKSGLPKTDLQQGLDYSEEDIQGVRRIRPRLLKRFQMLSDEDLIVAGIFLASTKPQRRTTPTGPPPAGPSGPR